MIDEGEREVDFSATINAVTNMRNNILHQDKSPALTINQIEGYILEMKAFSKSLEVKIKEMINAHSTI